MQEGTEEIVLAREIILDVFNYVMPCIGKKRSLDGKDDSATQHYSKRSSCSESVDNHLVGLVDQKAVVHGLFEQRVVVEKIMMVL
jgi:hypothetical protein